jgi:murein DD-endopeptidase MepM/ murein hydrolase activator NlpD
VKEEASFDDNTTFRVIYLTMILRFCQVFFAVVLVNVSVATAQLTDQEIYNAKDGLRANDTSYIYWLPYQDSRRFLLVQAANSKMSHRDELSLDFKMKPGSLICAARDGIVIQAKGDSNMGGLDDRFLAQGNHIIILHSDSSVAKYWHLAFEGLHVKAGDMVKQGQPIALSGNTGYSAFPHLHFQVLEKNGRQILTRFQTRKSVIYLRPGKWYKSTHRAH